MFIFVLDDFSGLFLHPSIFPIKHSRCYMIILNIQLFSRTFIGDLRLFAVAKE